ncbi:hypothetical protein AB0A76_27845 [Streptomyces exfoliatus]|uniref:Uncharacterized protein n=1 Tax=Streptomyces exfoliatus TaxID=1905 RepID=A0ABV3D3D5_STREX
MAAETGQGRAEASLSAVERWWEAGQVSGGHDGGDADGPVGGAGDGTGGGAGRGGRPDWAALAEEMVAAAPEEAVAPEGEYPGLTGFAWVLRPFTVGAGAVPARPEPAPARTEPVPARTEPAPARAESADIDGLGARPAAARGQDAAATGLAARALGTAARTDSPIVQGLAALDTARTALLLGRPAEAADAAARASRHFAAKGHLPAVRQAEATAVQCRLRPPGQGPAGRAAGAGEEVPR